MVKKVLKPIKFDPALEEVELKPGEVGPIIPPPDAEIPPDPNKPVTK